MLRSFMIFTFVLISACSSTPDNNVKRAQLHLKMGTGHLSKQNYPAALRELLKAQELNPQDPVVENNLGLAYFVRGKLKKAEKHMRKAVQLEPKYTEARNNLARTLIEQHFYDEAIEQLKIALDDLTYNSPEKSYANLGIAYFHQGKYRKAINNFKESFEARKGNCSSMNYYGRSLFEAGKYQAAAQALDQASKMCQKSQFDEPHYYSALSYLKMGMVEQAKARFKEVMTSYPEGRYVSKAAKMLKLFN